MWIIPKTLSQYAPATPGLSLESSEQAWMLEQSVTWRSKFMSRQYWSKRWRKGDYVRHLCGLMLKPSLHQSFVEKYTASLPDIPVSRSVARASEKARMTQDTYGHISEATSGQLDLFGAFSKMSGDTSLWGYGESCPIWKRKVTKRSGDCSARRKQARLTNASDASSLQNYPTPEVHTMKYISQEAIQQSKDVSVRAWATPNTMDYLPPKTGEALARNKKKGGCKNLREDVNNPKMNWPTASTSDSEGGPQADRVEWTEKGARLRKKGKKEMVYGAKLRDAVENHENWPTPRAGNPGSRKPGTGGKILAEEAKIHAGPPAPEKSSTSGKNHGSPKLNANWVEQLMGLSTGWTDLGSWGTE